jgi:segregation and condensation protein A
MTLQEDYQVTIDSFCGPLDLLLYLIRRAEVDIQEVPIASITDQYLGFLKRLDDIDVDGAGEFLVMAATLIEIKSRSLMPVDTAPAEGDDGADKSRTLDLNDPRQELIQQLLAYQRYRVAAEMLDDRRLTFGRRVSVRPASQKPDSEAAEPVMLELDDVHRLDLSEAYEAIMASIDFTRLGDHTVELDDTPLALYQEDLLDQLGRAPEQQLSLQDAFTGQARPQRIGLFLATLELVRMRRITVIQQDLDADIVVTLVNEDEIPDEAPPPPEASDPATVPDADPSA